MYSQNLKNRLKNLILQYSLISTIAKPVIYIGMYSKKGVRLLTMRDEKCIFCKIANGEIPSNTIFEDEEFRAILDLAPATRGHALILPKNHYENLFELPEEIAAKAMVLAKRLACEMKDRLIVTDLISCRIMEKLLVKRFFIFICT